VVVELLECAGSSSRRSGRAPRATRPTTRIAELEEILRRQERKMRRGEPAIEEDSQFHYALALAAGNSVLQRCSTLLMDLLRESRARSLQVPAARALLRGAPRILRAIKRRDAKAAEKAVKQQPERDRGSPDASALTR